MGFFKRLRAASGSRKPPENASHSSTSGDSPAASPRIPGRSPPTNLLAVPTTSYAPPVRVTTSSTVGSASSLSNTARNSILPWKKDKRRNTDELQSIPYESTTPSPLRSFGGAQRPTSPSHAANIPSISTRPPSTPARQLRPTPNSYSQPNGASSSFAARSPSASHEHQRTRKPSHESQHTVISLSSTFTGRSRRTSGSTDWKQEGGVLGKFAFESNDWGHSGATTIPFQSPPPTAGPSKQTTPGTSPSKLTSHSPALAVSRTPKPKAKESNESGISSMRKLGAAHTSPSLPSVSTFGDNPWGPDSPEYRPSARDWPPSKAQQQERADVTTAKGKGTNEGERLSPIKSPVNDQKDETAETKARGPPRHLVKNGTLTEELEEIFTSTSEPDLDEKKRFWKPGMRTRRTSKSRTSDDRPVSMSHVEQRPPLRRPQSSLFHNPFGRTQSRVSLTFELDQPSPVDDGSFQLKSFRHISGASDAEGGFSQYRGIKKSDGEHLNSKERSAASTIVPQHAGSSANSGLSSGATSPIPPPSPSVPPRPRPPSVAGSESSQRVSVAAFRKNIRRPSSSMLIDDDDDVPLSLSRTQLFESSGLQRDSGSALSLTDQPSPPAPPRRSLPLTPSDDSRDPSPSPIGLGVPPPVRNSASPSPGFVVKGTWRAVDTKDTKKTDPISERVPSPLPAHASIVTGSPKVVRPPRASSLSDEAKDVSMSPIMMTPRDGVAARADGRSASRSPPAPAPAPLNIPGPQASPQDLLIKLPPRPDELPDGPTSRETPTRGATLSPTFAMSFDEPLRRISGLWSGTPDQTHSDNDDSFDPSTAETTLRDSQRGSGGLEVPANQEHRQSFYDRLAAATSSAITTASNALPTSTSSDERLYIPPVRTPSPPPILASSPTSEHTASPVPAPPVMAEAPAAVPSIPHSSFGRALRLPVDKPRGARTNKQGWASSSDEEDDDRTRPRPVTSASINTTRTMVVGPRPKSTATRPHSSATMLHGVELISGSSDEDEPLQALKTSRSRNDLRELQPGNSRLSNSGSSVPMIKTPESLRPTSILKPSMTGNGYANGHANAPAPRSRTGSMPNGQRATVMSSASKWSLSSAHDSDEEELHPPVRPGSRPASRNSAHSVRPSSRTAARPASHVSTTRDSSADHGRPVPRTGSSDYMPKLRNRSSDVLPRNKSSDLLPSATGTDRLRAMPSAPNVRHPAPRHPMSMVVGVDGRPTASPASSQSGLTGDSSGQQPMTPRSGAETVRRSWADGRLRPDVEAATTRRPASQFDWASSASATPGAPVPMGYPAGMDPYGGMNKQHMYAQFKAMADAHFEDMWERASSVGTANTAPQANMFQQTYGYSYNQPPMPMMPPMPYGGYGQYPYGAFGSPQVAFPSGMPMGGMMPPMGGIPMQGMPMGGGGYAYGPGAQSVYGGEFGPPVAPGMRETAPGSGGGSPSRRARRISGLADIPAGRVPGRPSSLAQGSSAASVTGVSTSGPTTHYGQQRVTPPRRQARRVSGLTSSEAGPPSSWRTSMGDDLETPRPKRVTNAS